MAEGRTGEGSLWGGRFEVPPAEAMVELSRSTHFDWALAPYDVAQGKAHAAALLRAGLLDDATYSALNVGLDTLAEEVASGSFIPAPTDEDVHGALERRLVEITGEDVGGRLRAGRSRNDQVATDLRLLLLDVALSLRVELVALCEALLDQAERHHADPAPGFTHLQHAQPVTLGHEIGKHVQPFLRDLSRLADWRVRTSVSPMGAGALAGNGLGLDPVATAADLGFADSFANSIDAVTDRDFVAEFLFIAAMIGVHLSRLGEEICLWATTEFGWVKLHDEFSTGSSIMPQKKNPDSAELARGKSGRLIGDLVSVLTMLKGLPFAYNRDLQEDKEPVFDAIATLRLVLPAMTGTVATLTFRPGVAGATTADGHALATELADWLVRRGMPFRQAHEVAGRAVKAADEAGLALWELDLADVDPVLDGAHEALSVDAALMARDHPGGTAPSAVAEQLSQARAALADFG
ncbi:MAG TPA: argininosuccinate lyase [Candidatus Nanopelagicales bacterium]|nr:argininosuccinate lyase [Candidatus Nanopelagicales bacterium]